jgi:hypothetical protein
MTGARFFVADFARAGKGYYKIKETVNAAYGNPALQKTAIYAIIKKVKASESTADMCHLNPKKKHQDSGSRHFCCHRHQGRSSPVDGNNRCNP